MTNAHSFPLLKLPNEEQVRVLRNLEERSILYFSLLSKKAKALIKSLGLKTDDIFLLIRQDIKLFFCAKCITFYGPNHHREPVRMLCKPENVGNQDMELKDWIDHVLFIYNQPKLPTIWFDVGYERFDLEAIKNKIPFQGNLKISRNLDDASANTIFNAFPHTDGLILERNIFGENQLKCRKLFVEYFKSLNLGLFGPFVPFGFNDLLLCNSESLEIDQSSLSEKEVNRFLKLWIKGSNSRLEFLKISFSKWRISQDQIIEGLKSQVVNNELNFKHRVYNGNEILGMFDIYRYDGVKGTIVFTEFNRPVFEFHVCHN